MNNTSDPFIDSWNATFSCPDPWNDPSTASFLTQFTFWFGGVFYCSLGVLGFFGNVVNILIFSMREMKSTFHSFLIVLSFADLGYILFSVLNEGLQMNVNNLVDLADPLPPRPVWVYLYPAFLFPMYQIFLTFSIYMTVVICLSRYMCIVYPFRTLRAPCDNLHRVDSRRIAVSTIAVVVGSILYSIPHFMEYEVIFDEEGTPLVGWTDLRKSHTYSKVYTIWIDFVVRIIIPVLVTVFTSARIFFIMRRHRNIGRRDRQFALTTFFIVATFIFCQSGKVVVNLHNFAIHDVMSACQDIDPSLGVPAWDLVMSRVARLLLLTNSSINIVVYFCTCEGFRAVIRRCGCLHRRFCCKKDVSDRSDETGLVTLGRNTSDEMLCYI